MTKLIPHGGGITIRIIDYYDLIELPSGNHIPAPMAIKMVGLRKVLEIPIAKKKRDSRFYFCQECRNEACYWCDYSDNGRDCGDPDCPAGFSFFKCQLHTNYFDPFRQKVKEIVFKHLVDSPKLINLLKYIEIDESQRWRSVGSMEVQVTSMGDYIVLKATGRMVEIAEIEYIREIMQDIEEYKDYIKTLNNRISRGYKIIAERLIKFLPDKIRQEFDWILDDIRVEYDKSFVDDAVVLEVTPREKLKPEEYMNLLYQLNSFLFKILPTDIFCLVWIRMKEEPGR